MVIQEEKEKFIRNKLLEWGERNIRDFPWREKRSPYHVIISEIMLHRTRSSQVVDQYLSFIKRYPNFKSICEAGMEKVMNDLKHLGLFWRSKMLYKLSCIICDRYDCELPMDKSELLRLPSIGEYTSSAVLCFVSDIPEPILDTNTVRIISRFFGIKMNDSSRRSRRYKEIMKRVIKGVSCREISYAMLDFGSAVCKKRDPKCDDCPLGEMCTYYKTKAGSEVVKDE